MFAHNSRNQWDTAKIQFMSYSVGCDSQDAWITEDNFFGADCSGVSIVGGLDISAEQLPNFRNLFQQILDYNLGLSVANVLGAFFEFFADVFEAFLHFRS